MQMGRSLVLFGIAWVGYRGQMELGKKRTLEIAPFVFACDKGWGAKMEMFWKKSDFARAAPRREGRLAGFSFLRNGFFVWCLYTAERKEERWNGRPGGGKAELWDLEGGPRRLMWSGGFWLRRHGGITAIGLPRGQSGRRPVV